ncbi:Hypothetical protein SCF082_LOCUS4971 [Durusdinium trenchii]|uniref:Uncharacterized protein n=1 Tax=Durusdinium trenchii TaxID=1381693 RepID=A0ABP0I6B5_9DINO
MLLRLLPALPALPQRRTSLRFLRQRALRRAGSHVPLRQALITLSGHTQVSSDNAIWNGIAQVMKEANANIEDATGTTVSSPQADAVAAARKCPRFVVNAFNTRIAPFAAGGHSQEDELAVAFLLKAVVREDKLSKMTDLFHSRFPGLVCTVTLGEAAVRRHLVPEVTGMIRLFGPDQVGQLARISEVLRSCRMTILNLYVTTGICDVETCEFVWREGGPLSENVITVAAIDRETFDEETFRLEVARASKEVGYEVTSIIMESEHQRAKQLARYYLMRKRFMTEWAKELDCSQNASAMWSI